MFYCGRVDFTVFKHPYTKCVRQRLTNTASHVRRKFPSRGTTWRINGRSAWNAHGRFYAEMANIHGVKLKVSCSQKASLSKQNEEPWTIFVDPINNPDWRLYQILIPLLKSKICVTSLQRHADPKNISSCEYWKCMTNKTGCMEIPDFEMKQFSAAHVCKMGFTRPFIN